MSWIKTGANLLFGTWGDDFAKIATKDIADKALKGGYKAIPADKGIFAKYKDLFDKQTWSNARQNVKDLRANRGQIELLKSPLKTIKSTYKHANVAAKEAAEQAAKGAAKSGNSNIFKRALGKAGGFLKKVPLIGAALSAVTELPEIYKAFKQEGLWGGIKQIGRSAATIATYSLGFVAGCTAAGVIGQVLCPIPGLGFALGMGFSMLADKMVKPLVHATLGKSPSEKEEEAASQQEQFAQNYNTQMPAANYPAMTTNYAQNPYTQSNPFNQAYVPQNNAGYYDNYGLYGDNYNSNSYDPALAGLSPDLAAVYSMSNKRTYELLG